MEYIYDIENYQLLGEMRENMTMERWSVGYFYRMSELRWYIAFTEESNIRRLIAAYSKNMAVKGYTLIAEEYKKIAKNIIGKRKAGSKPSFAEMKAEYYTELQRINDARNSKKADMDSLEKYIVTNDLKRSSFVDYALFYAKSDRPIQYARKDYVWLHEDGSVFFEGRVLHDINVYFIGTTIENVKQNYGAIMKTIKTYLNVNKCCYLSDEIFTLVGNWARLKNGYIEKEVCLDELRYEDIINMYETAIQKKEFPDDKQLADIKKRIDDYLQSMNESR